MILNLDYSYLSSDSYRSMLLAGLQTTWLLFVMSCACALVLGAILAIVRQANLRLVNAFIDVFVEYHRNTPLLVQLFIWYFVVPQLLPPSVSSYINHSNVEFIYACIAISLCFAAYISEDLRAGFRALPRTQYEAARAMGFDFVGALFWIVFPQAWRNSMPSLINQVVFMFKATSLASVIGVAELTYQARMIEGETFRVFETFSVISLAYLSGTIPLMLLGHYVARRTKIPAR